MTAPPMAGGIKIPNSKFKVGGELKAESSKQLPTY
jgi:hypothetical protein